MKSRREKDVYDLQNKDNHHQKIHHCQAYQDAVRRRSQVCKFAERSYHETVAEKSAKYEDNVHGNGANFHSGRNIAFKATI